MRQHDTIMAPVKRPETYKAKRSIMEMAKEESLVVMAFKTTDIKNTDRYGLDVLSSVMSGASGRLFAQLRNKSSLAYTLGCDEKLGVDSGYFVFYIATTKDRIQEAKKALTYEIKLLCDKGLEDQELARAKKELVTGHHIRMQTNSYYSLHSALDELYGLGYGDLYKYADEIEKVTKEDIKNVAQKYFSISDYAEVVVEPK